MHHELALMVPLCMTPAQRLPHMHENAKLSVKTALGLRAVTEAGGMKISREELYRRVWESPVVKLAKEFDVSDVGLAKACRASSIPLPPRGYWMKLQHGEQVTKPDLPPSNVAFVVIDAPSNRLPVPPNRKVPAADRAKIALQPPSPDVRLAPLAAATRKKLLSIKQADGLIEPREKDAFACRVSKGGIEEACRLLDALEKAAPQYGGMFAPGKEAVEFLHDGQAITLRLLEQYTTTQEPVPGRTYAAWERPPVEYHFTGKFALEILDYFEGRKRWTDGKRQRLCEVLVDVMEGLVIAAQAVKQRRLDMEEQRRRWDEEAKRRAERERLVKDRNDFRTKLLAEAQAEREHQALLEYLASLHDWLDQFVGPLPESSARWLSMARRWARAPTPVRKRVARLTSGVGQDYYSGTFGKILE